MTTTTKTPKKMLMVDSADFTTLTNDFFAIKKLLHLLSESLGSLKNFLVIVLAYLSKKSKRENLGGPDRIRTGDLPRDRRTC